MSRFPLAAVCPAGQYFDLSVTVDACVRCDYGTWQDQSGQSSCKPCSDDQTTLDTGSTSQDECIGQQKKLSLSLSVCLSLSHTYTLHTLYMCLSHSADKCGSGFELQSSGACKECAVGTYLTQDVHTTCQACTSPWTTHQGASQSANDCNLSE